MIITESEAIERIAERTIQNTRDIRQKNNQRRHQVVDLYGMEFTRQGDAQTPATFYVSISTDMVYLERFQFKLIIQPFASSVQSGTQSAVVDVKNRNLSVNGSSITPNPHDHDTEPHTHNLVSGISLVHTQADDFDVSIAGIDVTPYLMAQYGEWIQGEGIWPTAEIEKDYDILEVASDLMAEGREEDANSLTRSGYKKVEIKSNSPFQVTMVLYLKYPHLNR